MARPGLRAGAPLGFERTEGAPMARTPALAASPQQRRLHAQSKSGISPPHLARSKPSTGGIRVLHGPTHTGGPGAGGYAKKGTAATHLNSQLDKGSDAPVPLYRKLFFPQTSASEAVSGPPQILAAQTKNARALDLQIYNLLALVCRGFISPWYSKISRDRAFFLEVVRIAGHVVRQLEALLTDDAERIDKIAFTCVSLPRLLQRHVEDHRTATLRYRSAYSAGALLGNGGETAGFEAFFHSLQPHVAISARQGASGESGLDPSSSAEKVPPFVDADYLRTVVEALLKKLLPPEDYIAETERYMVREVIVGIVLSGVLNKVGQPWFIYGMIAKTLEQQQQQAAAARHEGAVQEPDTKPSFSIFSVMETLAHLPTLFYRMTAFFASLSLLVTTALASPFYRSERSQRQLAMPAIDLAFTFLRAGDSGRQVVDQLRWAVTTSTAIGGSLLDRIITHFFYTRIFTAAAVSAFLTIAEGVLFPGGYPGPAVPDPTEEEQEITKDRAYRAVENSLPASLLKHLLPGVDPADAAHSIAKDILDPFGSHYCNTHLIMFLLDLIVANVCPELVVKEKS